MEEPKKDQNIRILSRSHFEVDGVKEVESFDEETAVLKTVYGTICLEGKGFKVSVLDTDRGVFSLDGRIDSLYFSDDKREEKTGFFGRRLG